MGDPYAVFKENRLKIRSWMEKENVDLVFLCDPPNVKYVVGPGAYNTRTMYEASFQELLIIDNEHELPTLVVLRAYKPYYVDREADLFDRIGVFSDIPRILKARKRVRNVVASTDTPERFLTQIKTCVPKCKVKADSSPIQKLRAVKTPLEIECIRKAAKIAMAAMARAQESCVEGRKECEVAGEIDQEIRSLGADTYSFSTIVSSGVSAGVMWEVASEKIIRQGELVMIDLGATKDCYNSEFTRTFPIGHVDPKLAEIYKLSKMALEAAVEATTPGTKAGDIDQAARSIVQKGGYDWGFFTGHSVGTAVWEPPIVGVGSKSVIKPNMFLALEPGIYLRGVGGVRLEQNVLVTDGKPEILTPYPFVEF